MAWSSQCRIGRLLGVVAFVLCLLALTTLRTASITINDSAKYGNLAGKHRQFLLDGLFWHAPSLLTAGLVVIRAREPAPTIVRWPSSPFLRAISDRSPPLSNSVVYT